MSNKQKNDPRYSNKVFSASSVSDYFKQYVDALQNILENVDTENLEKAFSLLRQAQSANKRIYVAGNGGSSAIADHLCCDWTKGTQAPNTTTLRTHSMSSNTALFTAIANDYGYEETFATQVEMFMEKGDVLVLISSSGNSPNIVKAAQACREKGVQTIAFTGFSGGKVREFIDVNIHVKIENYGLVEDSHQVLMHCFAQFLAQLQDKAFANKV